MKQKTYNNIKPEKFSIENIENGKCTVLFFDDIKEEEDTSDFENESATKKIIYSYDTYSIEIPYRDNLAEIIQNDISNWLKSVKEKDYNEVAAKVREKRDKLLAQSDKEMCIDRLGLEFPEDISMTNIISSLKNFFEGFSSIINGNIAEYRQALRDLPEQEGFPYNVVWPTKDKIEE